VNVRDPNGHKLPALGGVEVGSHRRDNRPHPECRVGINEHAARLTPRRSRDLDAL
jgi:hypothetical protein